MNSPSYTSKTPYLIRALHEWCSDNGLTPHIAVQVNDSVHVPREHVKDGQIVLNISWDATSTLQLGNDYIEFKARFGGMLRDIVVPTGRVAAIYARETMEGLAFTPQDDDAALPSADTGESSPATTTRAAEADLGVKTAEDGSQSSPPAIDRNIRPALKRVK